MTTNVKSLRNGADQRCETLLQALKDEVYERGAGMPVPSVIGVIEVLKQQILREQEEV